MGSWMVFRSPGPILDPLGPPGWAHLAPKCPQNGQNGTQKRLKNAKKNREILFCSKSLPEGCWMVSRPQNPLKTCNGPHRSSFWTQFVGKMGHKGPQKRVFLKEIFFTQNYFGRGLWPFLWLHKSDMKIMRSTRLHHAHEELSSIGTLVKITKI